MDVKLVGITGKAGAGKDTLASFLLEAHMDESRIGKQIAFADPVKKATAEMYGIPLNNLYDRELKETVDAFWGISPRQMAQLVGTDMARNVFDDQIWIKRAQKEIKNNEKADLFVITDVRFENEAEFIRESGGYLIHIKRPDDEGSVTGSDHESENGVSLVEGNDIEFVNGGSLDELKLLARVFYAYEISNRDFEEYHQEIFSEYQEDAKAEKVYN